MAVLCVIIIEPETVVFARILLPDSKAVREF